jgi:outer membrane lipoprotein-sorting protein
VLSAGGVRAEMTAREIVDKMLERNNLGFESGEARVRLVIKNRRGETRERIVNSKSDKNDGRNRTRITFLEPADVRGTTLLILEQEGDAEDLQYLYLPALKRVRRISGSAKRGSFMGTDFTYDDLESRDIEQGEYTRQADETFGGQSCYRIDVEPTREGEVYSQLKLWIHKKYYLPLKIEFFDEDGDLLKVLTTRRIEKKGDRYMGTEMLMKNVQEGSQTTIHVQQIDLGATFPDATFDRATLGR